MTVKELLERRNKLVVDARALNDKVLSEKRAMTPEEDGKWKEMNSEIDRLKAEADRAERLEQLDKDLAAQRGAGGGPTPGREDVKPDRRTESLDEKRTLCLQGWFAEQMGDEVSDEQREAAQELKFNLRAKQLSIPALRTAGFRRLQRTARTAFGTGRDAALAAVECRDMVVGAGPSGGYLTAPEDLVRKLELAMLAYGGIYEHAEVIRTAQGNPIGWPTGDDTTNTGEWIGETQSIGTTSVDPSLGKSSWSAHKVSSKPIKVSYELLRDSIFDLPGIIGTLLGERIGRAKATAFATGSGAKKPLGLMLSTTLGVTAASASSITMDEILDLIHSVDRAYRIAGCAFAMNDATVLHLRKKKDGDGQYQWRPGLEAGAPDTLWGYPIVTVPEIAVIAASAKVIAFGQLSAYKVREVGAIRLYRLGELYRETDEDGFIAFHEADGGLLDAGTHPVKHLAMHA